MEIFYTDLGGRLVCCRFDNVLIVDKMYQREFEQYMVTYELGGLDALVSEFSMVIGL